jgi:hypothetical protein
MKSILILATLFFTQLTFANNTITQNTHLNEELYDCDFAGQTSSDVVQMKNDGMTIDQLEKLVKSMPKSSARDMYEFYAIIGYQHNNAKEAYHDAYQICSMNRS